MKNYQSKNSKILKNWITYNSEQKKNYINDMLLNKTVDN